MLWSYCTHCGPFALHHDSWEAAHAEALDAHTEKLQQLETVTSTPPAAADITCEVFKLRAPYGAWTATSKPGRNEPCPCGSGLRFKLCHGRLA